MEFSADCLKIDIDKTIDIITTAIRHQVYNILNRRGAVLGVSGGIDSAVCAALCTRALGEGRVLALLMPEKESSVNSFHMGKCVIDALQISVIVEDITAILESSGCYQRRLEAIRSVFPDYGDDWRCKIIMPSVLENDRLNIPRLTVQSTTGDQRTSRMPLTSYLQLISGTNMKQRTRKAMEYYHADRLNYTVCGTPNRLEYDQGFFVKNGDGSADFKPIAHLYKTQVYDLARALKIPEEILSQPPTTDTYSLEQTQEEFFFSLPYDKMDLCLYGYNNSVRPDKVGQALGLSIEQIERIYQDIESKRRGTRYLHLKPLLVEEVREIQQENNGVTHSGF